MKATISLGSNLGDRFQYLQNALDSINEITGTQVHSVSPVFETDPVGGPEQGQYLNAVAVVKDCACHQNSFWQQLKRSS
jgi:2-amino-4-hydroxy-6-hydroxymethyldihydropteridine diphosphokinase